VKVVIDVDACTGHGRCYEVAPDLFEADPESGYGSVIHAGDLDTSQQESATRATNVCPEGAIALVGPVLTGDER
jgi:ferredoxin